MQVKRHRIVWLGIVFAVATGSMTSPAADTCASLDACIDRMRNLVHDRNMDGLNLRCAFRRLDADGQTPISALQLSVPGQTPIDVDLSAIAPMAVPTTSRWDDVPAASVDYAAARASIGKHIELLLDELAGKR